MDLRRPEDLSVLRAAFGRAAAAHVGIDIQRFYCEPGHGMGDDIWYKFIGKTVARIGDFTAKTRAALPPVWVNHTSFTASGPDLENCGIIRGMGRLWGGVLTHAFSTAAQRARWQVYGTHAAPGDVTVGKPGWDGFENTKLDGVLKARGADTLVLTGFFTDQCVMDTAHSAVRRGYEVFVVADLTRPSDFTPKECWHDFCKMGARVVMGRDVIEMAVP